MRMMLQVAFALQRVGAVYASRRVDRKEGECPQAVQLADAAAARQPASVIDGDYLALEREAEAAMTCFGRTGQGACVRFVLEPGSAIIGQHDGRGGLAVAVAAPDGPQGDGQVPRESPSVADWRVQQDVTEMGAYGGETLQVAGQFDCACLVFSPVAGDQFWHACVNQVCGRMPARERGPWQGDHGNPHEQGFACG